MKKCTECGKELEDNYPHEMCEECMDNFATMIINSPFNPAGDFGKW